MAKQLISARGVDCPGAKQEWGLADYPYPFSHVFVTAENGFCWGCFGRGISEVPDASTICQGLANLQWVMQIASLECPSNPHPCISGAVCSKSPCAGITFTVNGICQNCANRLLLPAGIDVNKAPGNEIATFLFGKFGLGRLELMDRVTKAADRANSIEVGAVSSDDLKAVLGLIESEEQDEYKIILGDMQEFLGIKIPDLPASTQNQIEIVHGHLYDQRTETYEDYLKNGLGLEAYRTTMKKHALAAFSEIETEIGQKGFQQIFGVSPQVAAHYGFGQ